MSQNRQPVVRHVTVTADAQLGSFEGARLLQLQRDYRQTFHERLKGLEAMADFAERMRHAKGVIPKPAT